MAINDELRNKNIKKQVYNFRYRNKIVKSTLNIMLNVENDLRAKINSIGSETLTKKRSTEILKWVADANTKLSKLVEAQTIRDFKSLISEEAEFQNDTIQTSLPSDISINTVIPSTATILALAQSRPYESKTMKQWFTTWSTENKQILENTVKSGVIRGQTNTEMVRELFGTKANNYKDGKLQINRNQLQTAVRTTTNHVLNTTKDTFYKENTDIVKGYQWVSTLDARTTLICANLDGLMDLYDGSVTQLNGEVPPAHWGCRSTTTPVLKSFKELGIDIDEVSESTRASMNGQVPETTTYPTWLKSQSSTFQKEVLGTTRYKLWKDDNVPLSQFVDNKNSILTIEQLKQKGLAINGGK